MHAMFIYLPLNSEMFAVAMKHSAITLTISSKILKLYLHSLCLYSLQNLAHALAPLWENTEQTYISTTKHTFRDVRSDRENIYHYLYYIRKEFEAYLRRPDSKQEFVSAFQKEYNEVAEDMREDEETKAELHQRVQVSRKVEYIDECS